MSKLQDFNVKWSVLNQSRDGSMPVSITYYGNAVIDGRSAEYFLHKSDRYSYFHQVIITRRFNHKLSIQLSPSLSHYNMIDGNMNNDHIAIAGVGRFKISPQTSLLFEVDQPITKHFSGNPMPNIGGGIEIATGSHSFQIFAGNYSAIIPQFNNVFTQSGDLVIGFNINRRWNF